MEYVYSKERIEEILETLRKEVQRCGILSYPINYLKKA